MGAKNSEQNSITYLKLKAKTSDSDPTPYFGKNEKKGDSWAITETFNSVDGYLEEISSETYEFEGEEKRKCKMKLKDPDGSITVLESNFNNMLYSVLNSLAGCKDIGTIAIDVWLGKSKGDNQKQYAQCAVKNNGEKTSWLYDWNNVPKPKQVYVEQIKKTVKDDSEVILFWQKVVVDISNRLKERVGSIKSVNPNNSDFSDLMPAPSPEPTTPKSKPSAKRAVPDDDIDSLPF